MSDIATQVQALHQDYIARTGLEVRLDYARQCLWHEWIKCGWSHLELATVIVYLVKGIQGGSRRDGALKFSNLIADLHKFEEDLAEAKKAKTAPGRAAARPATSQPAVAIDEFNGDEAAARAALAESLKGLRGS